MGGQLQDYTDFRAHAFQHATSSIRRKNVVLRQVGWLGHSGAGTFYRMDETPVEPGGYSPIYFEVGED